MKKSVILLLYLITIGCFAQSASTIKGVFEKAKQADIRLMGFNGTKDTLLSQTTTDEVGNFTLHYPKQYRGAATIQVKEMTNLIVLLNQENFNITWLDFKDFASVKFMKSKENEWFQQAYTTNIEAQKRLAGLQYLLPLYSKDMSKKEWTTQLENEISIENNRFEGYLQQLPSTTYVKDYLKYRFVLQKMQQENKTKEEEIAIENIFLAIDFNSLTLFHSGLAKELFDEYINEILKLQNKESIVAKLNAFSDIIKRKTNNNSIVLNDYSEYLVKHYEQYGLIDSAEHLALSLLDDAKCLIDSKTLPVLEQYKKMALGNEAPTLELKDNGNYQNLKEIPSKYKVVVFGASWCEECQKEIPQLKEYAETFKTKYDALIIFISIDTDKEAYVGFIKDLPFIKYCDFKGWSSSNIKNWYVFATPSIYVVDEHNKIVAKPIDAIDTAKWLFDKASKNN